MIHLKIKKIMVVIVVAVASFTLFVTVASASFEDLLIDDTSKIADDLILLGITEPSAADCHFSTDFDVKSFAMFGKNQNLYIYLKVSQAHNTKLITGVTINGTERGVSLYEIDASIGVVKLRIAGIAVNSKNEFKITRYKYQLSQSNTAYINRVEIHYFGFDNDNYYYQCVYENNIIIEGMLYSKTYDYTTGTDVFLNIMLWPAYGRDETLTMFYYVFNLYDNKEKTYFVPSEITQIKCTYTEYAYDYKVTMDTIPLINVNKMKISNETRTPKNQTIVPATYTVDVGTSVLKFFGKKLNFTYKTIAKLSAKDKADEPKFKNYSYISQVGIEGGYKGYATSYFAGLFGLGVYTFTGHETEIEDINIYNISYVRNGRAYQVDCDSIIKVERKDPPTGTPPNIIEESSFWDKIKIILIIGAVAFLVIYIGKTILEKKKKGKTTGGKKIDKNRIFKKNKRN